MFCWKWRRLYASDNLLSKVLTSGKRKLWATQMWIRTSIANKGQAHTGWVQRTAFKSHLHFIFPSIYFFAFKKLFAGCVAILLMPAGAPWYCRASLAPGADPGCCEATGDTAEVDVNSDAMLWEVGLQAGRDEDVCRHQRASLLSTAETSSRSHPTQRLSATWALGSVVAIVWEVYNVSTSQGQW